MHRNGVAAANLACGSSVSAAVETRLSMIGMSMAPGLMALTMTLHPLHRSSAFNIVR